ncbi:hypothetical protein Tco_1468457 [Tanacetum coccineum]
MADEPLAIPLDEIQVDDKLHFIKEPIKIMDCEVKRLKQSRIPILKLKNFDPNHLVNAISERSKSHIIGFRSSEYYLTLRVTWDVSNFNFICE